MEDPIKAEEMANKIKMKMIIIRKFIEAKKLLFFFYFHSFLFDELQKLFQFLANLPQTRKMA